MQLVLNHPGTKLNQKNQTFEIINNEKSHIFSPENVKSILIASGVRISSQAILLAVEHDIDLLIMDQSGKPQARIWSHRFGSVSTIRKQQVYFGESAAGARWVIDILSRRLTGMRHFLKRLSVFDQTTRAQNEETQARIKRALNEIRGLFPPAYQLDDETKATLRGLEGSATSAYFRTISQVLPESYQFERRSRRPAMDYFNAILNYLYGILYGRIEIALIKAGVDPYLGVFHRDEYNRPVLVYDMIELFRVWAEEVAIQICRHHPLKPGMFSEKKGGFWLEKEGRQIVIQTMNEFLNQPDHHSSRKLTRLSIIQKECHGLAKMLLNGI